MDDPDPNSLHSSHTKFTNIYIKIYMYEYTNIHIKERIIYGHLDVSLDIFEDSRSGLLMKDNV